MVQSEWTMASEEILAREESVTRGSFLHSVRKVTCIGAGRAGIGSRQNSSEAIDE